MHVMITESQATEKKIISHVDNFVKVDSIRPALRSSRRGGIGRRARLKIEFLVSAGSIPAAGIFLHLQSPEP